MEKKISTGLILAGLGIGFALISLLVVLSGRHRFFIKSKLKIGAIILTLSGAMSSCSSPPMVTCYAPLPPPKDKIEQVFSLKNLEIFQNTEINGNLLRGEGTVFSFAILNSDSEKILVTGDIEPVDGAYDQEKELVKFQMGTLAPGTYLLGIYQGSKESIGPDSKPLFIDTVVIR